MDISYIIAAYCIVHGIYTIWAFYRDIKSLKARDEIERYHNLLLVSQKQHTMSVEEAQRAFVNLRDELGYLSTRLAKMEDGFEAHLEQREGE